MRRALALALSLAALACTRDPITEIVVAADTDLAVPAELDTIRFEVTRQNGTAQEASTALTSGVARPVTLGLVSRDGAGTLEIVAIGERGGVEIVRRTARVAFVRGRIVALRMDLWSRCVAELCGAERTCGDSGCRPVDVDASELTDWTGAPPDVADAEIRGDDAGPTDAGTPIDARPSDAGIDASIADAQPQPGDARADAYVSPDAYVAPDAYVTPDAWTPECIDPIDCDDGFTCTTDACTDGRCTHATLDAACDDGLACTTDRCDAIAGCVYEAVDSVCEDGIPCTTNACDRLLGCTSRPVHSMCTTGSYCDAAGGCTVAPTFTDVYTGIIQARCGPCHTAAPVRGMLDMTTQALAHDALVGTVAVCGAGVNTRVIPGDSSRSLLWRKVAGVDLCGSRMPRMLTPLDDAQIATIAHWIEAGALE